MSRNILAAALIWCGAALASDIPNDARAELLKHHDQAEVELGELAQQKAGSPAVEQCPQMMIEDHQKGDHRSMSLAREPEVGQPARKESTNRQGTLSPSPPSNSTRR